MDKKKCALYIRVSTLRQADVEDGSLDAQESKLKAYVNYENNNKDGAWEIEGIYREEGRSGKDLKRPQFQLMMRDIDDGKINTVIIWKIDRLTRSLKDFSSLWDMFQQKGIEIISLNEKFDTTTAIGRAMLSIVLVFAQLEREQTGERTSVTMQYRAEQGLWNGGHIIGYDLDPDEKGILKVNEEQAQLINKAYDLCIEKGSAGKTQKILNELGYRTPAYVSRRGKNHGGNLFTKQVVIKMLSNPVYLGKVVRNDEIFVGKHKAIISEKKFNKVQQILQQNRKTRSNAKRSVKHVYLLKGILRCGKCGSMMTSKSGKNSKGNPYYYYQCTKNTHIGKKGCDAKYIPAEAIENFIIERVKELTTDETEIQKMIAKANKKGDKKIQTSLKDKKSLSSHLQTINKKLNKIVNSIESGNITAFESLNKRIDALEVERKTTKTKLDSLDFGISEIEKDCLSAETMCESFKAFRDILDKAKPQQLKELLFRIVEIVEWHEAEEDSTSGHCKISYFEQPNLILGKKKLSEQMFAQRIVWLPSTDLNRGLSG